MGLHRRSIRLRIFVLILIPLLSLIGLYVFAASITVGDAVDRARATALKNDTGLPTGTFEGQADAERRVAVIYLAAPNAQSLAALDAQEAKTDQALAAMRAALRSSATMSNASDNEKQAIAALLKGVAGLSAVRTATTSHTMSRAQVMTAYTKLIEQCETLFKSVIERETNGPLVVQGLALVRMGASENVLLEEDTILEADMAARSFSPADRRTFAELVGARRALLADTLPELNANDRYFYAKNVNPQLSAALESQEDAVIADTHTSGPPRVSLATWGTDVAAVSAGFSRAGTEAANDVTRRAQPIARGIYLRLILAGGLGLLAVIASIIVSIWIGRGLVRELAELRKSALTLAGERLPRVVARLREGEDVDVSAEAPPLRASTDEIGQVSLAFNTVQRTAIEATVDQARLRRGISDVFRNLARRSQSLLHRQLSLLDTMERRTGDPDELADLYRLDHLTTRMRRHAEGLIILSGAAPGRSWRNPVRLVDVLRASVAEVEDYTRVNVSTMTQAALAGPAVADVIHMIAELVENATVFSPPNTPVRLTGDVVGKGFAIEVEDRGLGMSEEKLADVNERLATPPEFDLSDSDQLGLFVAGRLAARHGIKISLRANPYGGTTAIVLIPRELVVSEEIYNQDTSALLAGESAVQPTGRHAARSEDIIAAAMPAGSHPYADTGEITGTRPVGAIPAGPGLADPGLGNGGPASPGRAGWGDGQDLPGQPGTPTAPFDPGTPAAPFDPVTPAPATAASEAPPATAPAETQSQAASWFHRSDNGLWPQTSVPPPTDSPLVAAGLTDLGLPRRIRQANLAPQLRETGPHTVVPMGDDSQGGRSPEQARAVMSAIQRGWERGRSAAPGSDSETLQDQMGMGGPADSSPAEEGNGGDEWQADGSQE
jgi:signal transduction histidine kinase